MLKLLIQQAQSLLLKLGLKRLQRTVPRQVLKQSIQQSQSQLLKLGNRVQQRGVEPEALEVVCLAETGGTPKWMEDGRSLLPKVVEAASESQNLDMMVDCWTAVSRRLISSVACRSWNAGGKLSPRVACRRGAGWRPSQRVACPSSKSCTAGTDSRVFALWVPYGRSISFS